jgi:hypothetical protein
MGDNQPGADRWCRNCGSNWAQAAADARTLGFAPEFASGVYSCCRIAQWADEQWLAWVIAAEEDGNVAEDVTRPLEISEPASELIDVPSRKPREL